MKARYRYGMRLLPLVARCLWGAVLGFGGLWGTGCGPGKFPPPKDRHDLSGALAHLEGERGKAQSFRAKSVMDYWVGGDKVKGIVWVMGKVGARLRFNALNPDAGTTAVDLACDGAGFEYVDKHRNCQLSGPCTRETIARLLGVTLEPDDFLHLAVGTTPIIGPDPRGRVTWDSERGAEVVELESSDHSWQQRLVLDGRARHWDVLESTVRDARGRVEWKLTNKDFETVTAEDGVTLRVPKKTRFQKPKEKADLIVDWRERTFNLELSREKFDVPVPPGLPECR